MASAMAPSNLYYSESFKIITVNVVTLVVAIFAVLLRLVSRWLSAAHFGWDDGLIVVGLVLTFGSSAFNFVAADHGAGKHQAIVSKQDQMVLAQIIYGIEILYGPLVTAIKCSILMLYLRLFGVRPAFRKTIFVMLALVVAWCVAVFFAAIFQASPPRLLWTTNLKDLPMGAHHIDFPAYLIGTAVPNVVMDFAILFLPVGIVWQLQISKRRKTALSAVFAVGAFVCGASIIRAYTVATVSFTDRTYAYASTLIWSAVEVNVGITCACLPVLQPVVQKLFGKALGTDRRSKYANDTGRPLRRGAKSITLDSAGGGGGGGAAGGPFRRLDENLVQVQVNPPRNCTWASASTPVEREVQMNAIHVQSDVELDRRVEEV
ncbi:MAG: hypothetical protein ASARMPRED_000919 [Alectoria sarmentosa]|nr:MAG: hypothetical protein ASARMPRED_000919 [Alectoria sarmentosa]